MQFPKGYYFRCQTKADWSICSSENTARGTRWQLLYEQYWETAVDMQHD